MKTPQSSFVTLRTSTIFYTKREKYPNKPDRQGICMPAYAQTKASSARSMSSSLYFVANAAASAAVAAFVAAAKTKHTKNVRYYERDAHGPQHEAARDWKTPLLSDAHNVSIRCRVSACLRARIFARLLPFRSRRRSNCRVLLVSLWLTLTSDVVAEEGINCARTISEDGCEIRTLLGRRELCDCATVSFK